MAVSKHRDADLKHGDTDLNSVSSNSSSRSQNSFTNTRQSRSSISIRRMSLFGHQTPAFVSNMSKFSSIMDIEVHKLQGILSQPLCCSSSSQYMDLGETYKINGGQFPREVLEDITLTLHEIIDCSLYTPLSADGILFCHETLGIAHYLLGDYESSKMSFMKAMWIHMKTSSFATHGIDHHETTTLKELEGHARCGLLQHRLATVYIETGQFRQALFLIQKVRCAYQETGLSQSNPIFQAAEESITCLQGLIKTSTSKRKRVSSSAA